MANDDGKAGALTAQRLRALLDYDPDTGIFRWKMRHGTTSAERRIISRQAGKIAGNPSAREGQRIQIDRVGYPSARLAWLIMTGDWPPSDRKVKRIDGDLLNCKWGNLRLSAEPSGRNGESVKKSKPRKAGITQTELKQVLVYDSETGVFKHHGTEDAVGHLSNFGYVCISISSTKYQAHRLAWLYVHGAWPENDLDHINRDRADNRIANLRPATRSQNMGNRGATSHNKSGIKGITYDKVRGRWMARMNVDGKFVNLGRFSSAQEAAAAYAEAAKQRFGEFAATE